jgi:hypothetical protein
MSFELRFYIIAFELCTYRLYQCIAGACAKHFAYSSWEVLNRGRTGHPWDHKSTVCMKIFSQPVQVLPSSADKGALHVCRCRKRTHFLLLSLLLKKATWKLIIKGLLLLFPSVCRKSFLGILSQLQHCKALALLYDSVTCTGYKVRPGGAGLKTGYHTEWGSSVQGVGVGRGVANGQTEKPWKERKKAGSKHESACSRFEPLLSCSQASEENFTCFSSSASFSGAPVS